MKKKRKSSRTGSSVAKSAPKKKTARLSAVKPQVEFTPGAVVLQLSKHQVGLLTGSTVRTVKVVAEPYKLFKRPPVGCGGGSPTGPWVFRRIEDEFD
jgi:hypothetical protein